MRQHAAQLVAAVHIEFFEDVMGIALDRAVRDHQAVGDLLGGVPQADQRRHLLFAPRQQVPALQHLAGLLLPDGL